MEYVTIGSGVTYLVCFLFGGGGFNLKNNMIVLVDLVATQAKSSVGHSMARPFLYYLIIHTN